MLNRYMTRKEEKGPLHYLALDIGTEYAKAVYVEIKDKVPLVIGVGRVRQDPSHMEGGAVASISGVVHTLRQAMTQGAIIAGVKPKDVVIGIAGQFVTGFARTLELERKRPKDPITRRELQGYFRSGEKRALEHLNEELAEALGYAKVDMELVARAVTHASMDGYAITDPLGFCGRNLELTLFLTFAPYLHVRAMKTIAERLELNLLGLVAEPYAVASSVATDETFLLGCLVMDVGGGSTDVALIHKRGIQKTKMVAMGGRAFTKGIARERGITLKEAEQVKLDYSEGLVPELAPFVKEDLIIWKDAMLLCFRELYNGIPLPPTILLCGGGSLLPGIKETLEDEAFVARNLFASTPRVCVLQPQDIPHIQDPKEFFSGPKDITPKSLAQYLVVRSCELF